jgi:hypothetical protein
MQVSSPGIPLYACGYLPANVMPLPPKLWARSKKLNRYRHAAFFAQNSVELSKFSANVWFTVSYRYRGLRVLDTASFNNLLHIALGVGF